MFVSPDLDLPYNVRCSCRARDLRKSLRLSAYSDLIKAAVNAHIEPAARS